MSHFPGTKKDQEAIERIHREHPVDPKNLAMFKRSSDGRPRNPPTTQPDEDPPGVTLFDAYVKDGPEGMDRKYDELYPPKASSPNAAKSPAKTNR